MKHRFPVLLLLVVLMSSLVSGLKGGKVAAGGATSQKAENEFLKNFTEALDVIQDKYADDVGSDKLYTVLSKGCSEPSTPIPASLSPRNLPVFEKSSTANTTALGFEFGR